MNIYTKIILLVLTAMLMMSMACVYGDDVSDITVNGVKLNFDKSTGIPFIDENCRTQVPLRIALEEYGATVEWVQQTNTAVVKFNSVVLEVPIGKKYIVKNGEKIITDACAIIKNDKTYLPIRPVVEALGAKVTWNSQTGSIDIIQDVDYSDEKYNWSMDEQESNKFYSKGFVYDKKYQYYVVVDEVGTFKIKKKNISNSIVDTITVSENNLWHLVKYDNYLYYAESDNRYNYIKKINLDTYLSEEVYKQEIQPQGTYDSTYIMTYTIYDNKLYIQNLLYDRNNDLTTKIGVMYEQKFTQLHKVSGLISPIYCYNSKMYFINEDKALTQFNLETNEANAILGNITVCSFNKNKIYYSDIDNNIYCTKLDNIDEKELLYKLDKKQFNDSEAEIASLNIHNGKVYFGVEPNYHAVYILNNSEAIKLVDTNTVPEFLAVYSDFYIYSDVNTYNDWVAKADMELEDNPKINDWVDYGKKITVEKQPRYNFIITKEDKKKAEMKGQLGYDLADRYLQNQGYYLTPEHQEKNNDVPIMMLCTPFVMYVQEYASDEPDIDLIDRLYDVAFTENSLIYFTAAFICPTGSTPTDYNAYIIQDEYIFYPEIQLDTPQKTNNYPDYPAYVSFGRLLYNNTDDVKIDLNRRAKLVIEYNGQKIIYIIDFSRYI